MIRNKYGMSASELARRSGVHRMTIYNIEEGKVNPSLETAHSISLALNMPIEKIFFGEFVNHELRIEVN